MISPSSRNRVARFLAIGLVLVYLIIGIGAAACPVETSGDSHGRHHHGGPGHGAIAHSLLCAWSCQVSPLLDLAPVAPISSPVLAVLAVLASTCTVVLAFGFGLIAARAPPADLP